jgi:hypothetical protein
VKEERAVVGRGADVERVRRQQRWQPIAAGDRRKGLVDRCTRTLHDVEFQPCGDRLERVEIGRRERIPRDEDRADPVGCAGRCGWRRTYDGEMILGPADPDALQGGNRKHGAAIDLARSIGVVPPGD